MKEEEAKTKQCPVMKGQRPNETKCVASDCMMWVWDYTQEQIDFRHEQTNDKNPKTLPIGHCGLARKP